MDQPLKSSTSAALDAALAILVWLCAIFVYLMTLYPGLGAWGGLSGDSAKFQYLGSVLGTAHPPGYPGYVLISFLFSHLPIGSLAYRINFMSAFFAALAAAMMYLTVRRLGCHRAVALSVGLSMAFGRILWSRAVIAEVYSLNAAFAAAIVLAVIRWGDTRRPRDLYVAIGLASLALGNHLTIATLAPALVLYAVVVDWRMALRPVSILATVAFVLIGLAQYLFIVVRTLQGAPYLEAQAANLRELFEVMRASRYAYQMFPFGVTDLLVTRLPRVGETFITEFGVVGAVLCLFGMVVAVRRRPREAVLLLLGSLSVTFLTLNVDADIEGFMLAAFVLTWPLVGVALEAVRQAALARGRLAVWAAMLVVAAVPALQLRANYRANDHHRRTFETRYFNTLFATLGDRTLIVHEGYGVDQLLLYKLIGEKAAGTAQIELVPPDPAVIREYWLRGYAVYAFSRGRDALSDLGAYFEPVRLDQSAAARVARAAGRPSLSAADMDSLPLYRLVAIAECAAIGNVGWVNITPVTTTEPVLGRIDDYRPFEAQMLFYLVADAPLAPRLFGVHGAGEPKIEAACFREPDQGRSRELRAAAAADAFDLAQLPVKSRIICRVNVTVNDRGDYSLFALDFGSPPVAAFARAKVDLNNPRRATVCGIPSGVTDVFPK